MSIAVDSVGQSASPATTPASPYTFSFTNAAGNYLIVAIELYSGADDLTGVTYNGVSMTQLGKRRSVNGATNSTCYLYGLASPATGAKTVSVSYSGSHLIVIGVCASYVGVAASQPDAGPAIGDTTASSITESVTTVANNAWAVMALMVDINPNPTAGAGATLREVDATYGALSLFDSNAAITPAGSDSMTVNAAGAGDVLTAVMVSLGPSAGGGTSPVGSIIQTSQAVKQSFTY